MNRWQEEIFNTKYLKKKSKLKKFHEVSAWLIFLLCIDVGRRKLAKHLKSGFSTIEDKDDHSNEQSTRLNHMPHPLLAVSLWVHL